MRSKRLDRALKAVVRSRKGKWAGLVAGTAEEEPYCFLCDLGCGDGRGSCPVVWLFGGCGKTPYIAWSKAAEDGLDTPQAKKHARREDKFLAAIQKGLEVMQRELKKVK